MTQFSKKGGVQFFSEIVKRAILDPPPPKKKKNTSGGRVDLWSKIAFLILVWHDTIFKKRGGLIFTNSAPLGRVGHRVAMSVCVSVCLCNRETPTSGGRVDLWSKIAFLILIWDDTILKKGGPIFFQIVSTQNKFRNAIFDQRSTRPPEVCVSRWRRQTHTHTQT